MPDKRPTTIAEYIQAAPREGQPHLRRVYAILKSVAPKAEETLKWSTPFFVEPRFLFSFSAHKAHLNFAPTAKTMAAFQKQLAKHKSTTHMLQVAYDEALPEALIRKMAEHCLLTVSKRKDDNFW